MEKAGKKVSTLTRPHYISCFYIFFDRYVFFKYTYFSFALAIDCVDCFCCSFVLFLPSIRKGRHDFRRRKGSICIRLANSDFEEKNLFQLEESHFQNYSHISQQCSSKQHVTPFVARCGLICRFVVN
jgi:hypothetical protein